MILPTLTCVRLAPASWEFLPPVSSEFMGNPFRPQQLVTAQKSSLPCPALFALIAFYFFFFRAPDIFLISSYVLKQLDYIMIFYFYLGCFTFSISYSVLPFHLIYAFQFLHLIFFLFLMFFLKPLSRVVEKLSYTYM